MIGPITSTYLLEDYKSSYFEHQVLTKINGQPTADNLLVIFCHFKRNAQCVSCTLGGGQLGYLGLILFPDAYSKIPNSQVFVRPKHPWSFWLVVDSTNPAPKRTRGQAVATIRETDDPNETFTHSNITQQKASHDEALRQYLEWQAVQQALRVQLIKAIDAIYLDTLRNNNTDMIHKLLPKIMEHLMKNYGQVTLEDM